MKTVLAMILFVIAEKVATQIFGIDQMGFLWGCVVALTYAIYIAWSSRLENTKESDLQNKIATLTHLMSVTDKNTIAHQEAEGKIRGLVDQL